MRGRKPSLEPRSKPCAYCGEVFTRPYPSDIKAQQTCSRLCRSRLASRQWAERIAEHHRLQLESMTPIACFQWGLYVGDKRCRQMRVRAVKRRQQYQQAKGAS